MGIKYPGRNRAIDCSTEIEAASQTNNKERRNCAIDCSTEPTREPAADVRLATAREYLADAESTSEGLVVLAIAVEGELAQR